MKQLNFTIVLKKEPEGGYTVIVPSLLGCVTYGKDIEEAKKMAQDAITAYITSLKKHKEPIPKESSVLFTTINVNEGTRFSFT
ncbi:type II toxin-antitoxin system HicB family antitoxin [Candidatus Curtissbacteria bacterium]|nr:type II toxin-antitoxin system HicB family antitoxin [Candidatus Curtissbacteria bacterium]